MDSTCTVDDIPLPCVQVHVHTYTVHVSERYHRCYAIIHLLPVLILGITVHPQNTCTYTVYVLYTTGGGILFILPSYLTSYTGTNARIVVLHIHSYHSILPLSQKLLAIF